MQKYSNCKLVISNHIFEFYQYQHEIAIGEKENQEYRERPKHKNNLLKNRVLSFRSSKRTLRRLVNTNVQKWTDHNGKIVPEKFVTLTFNTQEENIKEANYKFKKFIQRLNYYYLSEKRNYFKYITVIEFMKNKRIHYHTLFFNVPYTPNNNLAKLWSNGFIKINRIDNADNVGSYVTKYMTKTEDKRLCGEKSYFTSRGLLKPIITFEKYEIATIFNIMPKNCKPFIFPFENEYTGKSIYYQFNLKKYPDYKKTVSELLTGISQNPIYEIP
jgi:hypothetical protein